MKNAEFGVLIVADEKAVRGEPLWLILDKPMVGYLLENILECKPLGVSVVVGEEDRAVSEYLKKSFPTVASMTRGSPEYNDWCKRFSHLLLIGSNFPFLSAGTIGSFMREHADSGADCSLLGSFSSASAPYALAFSPDRLASALGAPVTCLSDCAKSLSEAGLKTRNVVLDASEALAVLSQADLAEAAARMRKAIVLKWMKNGVLVTDPDAVWIGPDAELAQGVTLMPGVQIWGKSSVGKGSVLGPYCILRNAVLGQDVNLAANVIVEDSTLDNYVKAGPFAYIREGSVLKAFSFAGKFVEIKKTSVGSGSKIPHLSYVGDAVLGEDVNIGAGSITCNYDGVNKSETVIGDRCFVGCDTMLVAPVTLEKDSMTGAGSTITENVPSGALAVGRARQRNVKDWVYKKKRGDCSCLA